MGLSQEFLDNPDIKDCCKQEANLRPGPGPRGGPTHGVVHCGVCDCRHYVMVADTAHFFSEAKGLTS